MAVFTWPFPKNPSAPPLLGIMALAVAAIAAIMLVAGLSNLQARTVQAQNVAADRAALVALYNSAGGASWTTSANWNGSAPLGDWHGVTTNAGGRVTGLNLEQNGLTGTIPAELGNLSEMTTLNLGVNSLTGAMPAELGNLSNLRLLILYHNGLTGAMPTELGNLSSLTTLTLNNNSLTGTIPAELGNLSSLTELYLNDNSDELAGPIPAELGNLSNLTRMWIGGNGLTGTIPVELGRLNRLTELSLRENALTGIIPAELGSITNLRTLELNGNSLTGTIPVELGNLSDLRTLNLGDNDLAGYVPDELGSLSNLRNLRLRDNDLAGRLPYSFEGLSALETLLFQNNAGLCAPLDSTFQTWLQGITTEGDNCPPVTTRFGAAAPVLGEPITVGQTSREAYLIRIQATAAEYANNPCIGYDTSGSRAGILVSQWYWERADADSNDPNAPDSSTWSPVVAGDHPNASFVYLPQPGDDGKFLRAILDYGSPTVTVAATNIGPIAANHGVSSGDQVSVAAPAGALTVGSVLSVSLSNAASAERWDPAINPHPERWQWERSDDGSTGWSDVTPYRNCGRLDSEYPLTSDDEGKYLRAYVYYNDDRSGSVVLKRAQTAATGPVTP